MKDSVVIFSTDAVGRDLIAEYSQTFYVDSRACKAEQTKSVRQIEGLTFSDNIDAIYARTIDGAHTFNDPDSRHYAEDRVRSFSLERVPAETG